MAVPVLKKGIGNSASTTLAVAMSNSDTSCTITSDTNFAAASGEGMILIDEAQSTEEIAYSASKTGATLSTPLANRGLEGGSAQAHAINATVKGILTVDMWNDVIDSLLNILDQTTGAIKSGAQHTLPQINDTTADHQYVFAVNELAADRTITLPLLTGNDTFVFNDFTATLTNKTLTSPVLTTPQINDTSLDHQYIFAGSELTADRTVTLPLLTGNDDFVFEDHTQTMTNKRVTPRVVTTTDDATAVIDCDVTDQYQLTAVANATTFTVTGTPTAGQKLIVRLTDAGVAKGLTWTGFTAKGATLPTTTVAGKTHYVGFIYNATASTWDCVAAIVES